MENNKKAVLYGSLVGLVVGLITGLVCIIVAQHEYIDFQKEKINFIVSEAGQIEKVNEVLCQSVGEITALKDQIKTAKR